MAQLRDIKSASAWCWQDKKLLSRIREAFDSTTFKGLAVAVYCGLTEIASDEASETFRTTHDWIALKSGASVATVKRVLHILKAEKLIHVDKPKLRGPATYYLLALDPAEPTLALADLSPAQAEPTLALGANTTSRATLEERERKGKKTEKKGGAHAPALPSEVVLWNSKEQLPKVQSFTQKRQRDLNARKKDPFFVENFEAAIELVCKSDFCLGENSRDWRADFDWILQPNTVAKIMEGKYQNKPAKAKPGAAPTISKFEPKEGKVEM